MGEGGGVDDMYNKYAKEGNLNNILARNQRGEPITEGQIQLLKICREDPEQRDRMLFGGGLY